MKTALITGVNGQDGSYLAELLLKKVTRFTVLKGEVVFNTQRIDHIYEDFHIESKASSYTTVI